MKKSARINQKDCVALSLHEHGFVTSPLMIIGGVVVLVIIILLIVGGNFKFSASVGNKPSTTQTENQAEQSQTTSVPKSYQSDQYKFSLQYPENWSVKEAQGQYVAAFLSPEESSSDKYREFLGVKAVSIASKPSITLQEAADLWEEQTTKESTANNFKVTDRKASKVSNIDAKDLVYSVEIEGIPAKGFVRVVLSDDFVYIFQYFAEADKYEKYMSDIESIISSVTL